MSFPECPKSLDHALSSIQYVAVENELVRGTSAIALPERRAVHGGPITYDSRLLVPPGPGLCFSIHSQRRL